METSTLLILVTAVAVLVFFGVVARGLMRIAPLLEQIGGNGDSFLAKLRLGLRAIERETSHLPAAAIVASSAGIAAVLPATPRPAFSISAR